MSEDNVVLSKWSAFKKLVEEFDLDVHKNAAGNAAAGVRARKGLRSLKKVASDLVKLSVTLDKAKKAASPPRPKKAAVVAAK